MTRTIHLVFGGCGEYADRQEWPVRAFADPAAALDWATKAQLRAEEVYAAAGWEQNRMDYPKGAARAANEFDPGMRADYTGTEYRVRPVPFAG